MDIRFIKKMAMDVWEKGVTSLKNINLFWNTFNHLNGNTKSKKVDPLGVLTIEEFVLIIA
jgi:hypothetical protein